MKTGIPNGPAAFTVVNMGGSGPAGYERIVTRPAGYAIEVGTGELELAALVTAEPLRERLWELLMLALYRSGQQAALAAYLEARRRHGPGTPAGPPCLYRWRFWPAASDWSAA